VDANQRTIIFTANRRDGGGRPLSGVITNPSGVREVSAAGVAPQSYNEFRGFNLVEQMVLNGHRRCSA